MSRRKKILITIIAVVVTFYFIYGFYGILRYGHSVDWLRYKQYTWILKDSLHRDIDTLTGFSFVRKRDIYNNFHYNRNINIIIWEFKDLGQTKLKYLSIKQGIDLEQVKFPSGEILNKNGDIEIAVKYGCTFKNKMVANLDKYSKIDHWISGENYKGFYGTISQMSLSNEKNENQILFSYSKYKTPTFFLFYTGHNSFFVILINSKGAIDENIIKILNLK